MQNASHKNEFNFLRMSVQVANIFTWNSFAQRLVLTHAKAKVNVELTYSPMKWFSRELLLLLLQEWGA